MNHFTDSFLSEYLGLIKLPFENQINADKYHQCHAARYALTLNALVEAGLTKSSFRVLELAASPYGMTAIMGRFMFNDLTLGGYSDSNSIKYINIYNKDHEMKFCEYGFNAEKSNWPFNNESFDLVIACEVIEHLALDPMMLFSESNRILRPNGYLFVSTPNAASYQNIIKLACLQTPGLNSQFRTPPSLSFLYERHNREYTPKCLVELFSSSGFDIFYQKTDSAYPINYYDLSPQNASSILRIAGAIDLRGDTLNIIGTKKSGVVNRYPEKYDLYLL
jgi:SAM-dependent methyltransferase